MRRSVWILLICLGCGGDKDPVQPDAAMQMPDGPQNNCQPLGATGAFYRRSGNPRLRGGGHTFSGTGGSEIDTQLADPDLVWDDGGQKWHLYYGSPHGTSFTSIQGTLIRHATSTDLTSWNFDSTPSIAGTGLGGTGDVGAPSVAIVPNVPADRHFVMAYRSATNGQGDYSIHIGFSIDGGTFTDKGQILSGTSLGISSERITVSDPELVYVDGTYHLWFTASGCSNGCSQVDVSAIGHATSTDALTWTVEDAAVPSLLRTSADKTTGGERPTVIYDDVHCRWEMWFTNQATPTENDDQPTDYFNSSGLWHATSTNGTSWNVDYAFPRDVLWDGTAPGEHLGMMSGATVANKGTGRYLLFTGFDNQNVPSGSMLPTRTTPTSGVMTLNLATRDAL